MPLDSLNLEQKEAASAPFGHNLIIASAGTGKTSTIVGRIAYLLKAGVEPSTIMLLTFTNKASKEMIERLERFFPSHTLKEINAGTFHAIAYRYLKSHGTLLLKQPRELKTLLKSIYDVRNFTHIDSGAPYKADYLYELISLYLNRAGGESFGDFIIKHNKEHEIYARIYEDIFLEFMDTKKQYNYASYDDLLLLYKEKIARDECEFSEILVDEYQDTNPLQNSIILSHKTKSLFCVGDYDQSIYAFNGSDISIIASFKNRFRDARIFSLSKNYRSSGKILQIANNVINNNNRIYPKYLEVMNAAPQSKVECFAFENTKEQYINIAKHIAASRTPKAQIAIIFRNNISADYMEASLRELQIASRKKGAKGFFESKEIAIFIDILNVLFNAKDMMAAIHILSFGSGISEGIAKDIYECLMLLGDNNIKNGFLRPKKTNNPYKSRLKNAQLGLFDDLLIQEDSARFNAFVSNDFASHLLLSHPKITKEGAMFLDKCRALFAKLESCRKLQDIMEGIRKSSCWREISHNIAHNHIKAKYKSVSAQKMQEALDEIDKKLDILFHISTGYDDLGRFLHSMILNNPESSSGKGVNLLTVHASKGLEFDDVYVIDLMDGRFPNTKLIAKTGSLEEERRLFYVATTRAKYNIYFSYAKADSARGTAYTPSIFLKEAGLF